MIKYFDEPESSELSWEEFQALTGNDFVKTVPTAPPEFQATGFDTLLDSALR